MDRIQDRGLQSGTDRSAKVERGALKAMADGPSGCGLGHSNQSPTVAWVSCGRRRWSPANGGLGWDADINLPWMAGFVEPQTTAVIFHERRAWVSRGRRQTRGTCDQRTPMPTCSGLKRDEERRLPCRGTDMNRNEAKYFQKQKTKRGKWAPLTVRSGLLSWCTQQGWTRRREYNSKLTV